MMVEDIVHQRVGLLRNRAVDGNPASAYRKELRMQFLFLLHTKLLHCYTRRPKLLHCYTLNCYTVTLVDQNCYTVTL